MRLLTSVIAVMLASGLGALLWHRAYRREQVLSSGSSSLFPWLLGVGLACRLVYLFFTPTFYAPDEQSHYNHIKFIATHGEFAVQTTKLGDPSNEWEHNQPPLYYVLLAPFYSFAAWVGMETKFAVWLMRSPSLLLWLLNVWLSVATLNRLRITDRVVRTFCLGLICLLPTYTFSSSAINNDNLLAMVGTAIIWWLCKREYSIQQAAGGGLLIGLSLLTKQSALVFIPLVTALVVVETSAKRISVQTASIYLSTCLGIALVSYLPWAVRNWQVYQTLTPEFFVVDKVQWPSFIYGIASASHNLVKSFWAVSGIANNINYPFPLIGMLLLVTCIGANQIGIRRKKIFDPLQSTTNTPVLIAMWVGLTVNVLLVLRFGYLFGMGQGRHLFPLLVPIALLLSLGIKPLAIAKLSAHCAGGWILYALSFLAFSLTRFPR